MKKIVVLAGDGIGPEIMASALEILKVCLPQRADFSFVHCAFGGQAIEAYGTPLPEETLAACQQADAILLGAVGAPKWEDAVYSPEKGLLDLRRALGLYANIRPIKVTDAFLPLSPLKEEIVKGTDLVLVRELTSGIYFGEKKISATDASDLNYYHSEEIRRILRKAFQIARTRQRRVVSVDKANVLATSKLWRRLAEEVAKEFPDCQLSHQYVDSAAMKIVQQPTAFDVIVTENLFGDILSDEASVLPGSLGVLPSASHSLSGVSLYEPIHGSAPDIAGKGIANPISMILSVGMMLNTFGMQSLANQMEQACYQVMEDGIVTCDLGGQATTKEFTDAVIKQLGGY
ncbi:3-isopropylmalate dehydrogenase [Enterococcus sp.]|uniref:3-isopropylmalate dehydrogenase n=1 Tax=Enterococcus sp. TaxID=35783 RepID=UPI0025BB2E41|nr:3-isopropylmalate dehydrogenase [Enterococcus sp.]